jgi:hypothetical protein
MPEGHDATWAKFLDSQNYPSALHFVIVHFGSQTDPLTESSGSGLLWILIVRVWQGTFERFYFLQRPLKDEQFLANLFNVIDFLADWFGWFVDVGHDANKLLFWAEKVGTLAVRIMPLFPSSAARRDSQLLNDTGLGLDGGYSNIERAPCATPSRPDPRNLPFWVVS